MSEQQTDFDGLSNDEFRARFRRWLEDTYPTKWRRPIVLRLHGDEEKKWLRMLHDHGWRAPAWPREHGGMGLSLAKQLIYNEEIDRYGAARVLDSGGVLLAPTLINHGTPEQQQRYLPEILRGDVIWCQGYSEPNAGSDLANLKLSAVRDGDAFVLNGSKIWTTMATFADHMFLLARTSQESRKQQGISFFLMDMDTPGVTVRPIENLAGDVEFGQVFFDNVRIPIDNVVGGVGNGWNVAKALLGVERIWAGSPALSRHAFRIFEAIAEAVGETGSEELHARLHCDLEDLTALYKQVADAALTGTAEGHDFSVLKIVSSELFQRISDASMQLASEHAGVLGSVRIGAIEAELHRVYMIARPSSIYGGANEVQRDIIARMLLGKAGQP